MLAVRSLRDFFRPKAPAAALPLCLILFLAALTSALLFRGGGLKIYLDRPELGSFLLAGFRDHDITLNMPLFETAVSLAQNLGAALPLLLAVRLGIYGLVFAAGCLLRGYKAGLLSLAIAGGLELGGAFVYDAEQSFYALFLLLVMVLLLRRRNENTAKAGVLAGLAIGASMLVRTPLVLFPPAAALCGWFCGGERSRAYFLRSLAFLTASYVLLLPWGLLNYSVSGQFSLTDTRRAASNIITSAKGSIYTMNGDPYRLGELKKSDSAAAFYIKEAVKAPVSYAATVLKRLWAVFLFHPLLFGAWFAALVFSRAKDRLFVSALPAYLFVMHSLFSVEERYFYPMLYLLPPVLAALLFGGPAGEEAGRRGLSGKIVAAVSLLSLLAVLAVEGLVLAYPYRAAHQAGAGGLFASAAGRFPGDRTMRDLACRELWVSGDDAGYYKCLGTFAREFDDKAGAYFLSICASDRPEAVPVPRGAEMQCYVLRMLRELELGRQAAAAASYKLAYERYGAEHNMLRGAPYAKDRELEAALKRDSGTFWSAFVYPALLKWPPERMAVIIPALSALTAPDGRLQLLADALAEMRSRGSFTGLQLREWAAPEVLGLSQGDLRALWKDEAKISGTLKASAAEQAAAGNYAQAEGLLLRALNLEFNPNTAEAFMALCSLRVKEGEKKKALEACQGAAYAAYFGAEGEPSAAGSEASYQSYEMLLALGLKPEARAALARTVGNAPDSWPRLPEARAALAGPAL
jgi:tetratricopeptide (TPR) repeat protein